MSSPGNRPPTPADDATPPTRAVDRADLPSEILAEARPPSISPDGSLGGYRLDGEIGRGGMGMVWKGWDENLDRPVALKLISPDVARDPTALDRLKLEARAAAALSHSGIVNVYQFVDQTSPPFIAMEYVEGRDLARLVQQEGPIAPGFAVSIVRQAAEALAYAAKRNLVHRDIKPSNIFLTTEGEVKVMDFGLAKRLDVDSGLTSSGAILGTPAYLSPEQALGQSVDFRADMYSLGCTLFTLLKGEKPFEGHSAVSAVLKHVQEPLPAPPEWKDIAGGELMRVLRRMTEKLAPARYPSWEECIDALRSLEESLKSGQAVPPSRKMPRWILPVAGAVLLLIAVVGAVVVFSGGNDAPAQPIVANSTPTPIPTAAPTPTPPPVEQTLTNAREGARELASESPPQEQPGAPPQPGSGPASPIEWPEETRARLSELTQSGDWNAALRYLEEAKGLIDEEDHDAMTRALEFVRDADPRIFPGENLRALSARERVDRVVTSIQTKGEDMTFEEGFEHVLMLRLLNAPRSREYEGYFLGKYPPTPELGQYLRLFRNLDGLHGEAPPQRTGPGANRPGPFGGANRPPVRR